MSNKIAVIDFDGTVVNHRFPYIGEEVEGAFETLKEMKKNGWKLILWTCRENHPTDILKQYLKDAVDFCARNGVVFDAVNETISDDDFREYEPRRKPYAQVHIDDTNFGGFPGWHVVLEDLRSGKLGNRENKW